jgi:Phosphopantetheine attachment site
MTIRAAVLDQMKIVALQQKKTLKPLTDDTSLLDSGLDSLCLAILVANLDDELGIDPFGSSHDVPIPVTVGDLVLLYESATV